MPQPQSPARRRPARGAPRAALAAWLVCAGSLAAQAPPPDDPWPASVRGRPTPTPVVERVPPIQPLDPAQSAPATAPPLAPVTTTRPAEDAWPTAPRGPAPAAPAAAPTPTFVWSTPTPDPGWPQATPPPPGWSAVLPTPAGGSPSTAAPPSTPSPSADDGWPAALKVSTTPTPARLAPLVIPTSAAPTPTAAEAWPVNRPPPPEAWQTVLANATVIPPAPTGPSVPTAVPVAPMVLGSALKVSLDGQPAQPAAGGGAWVIPEPVSLKPELAFSLDPTVKGYSLLDVQIHPAVNDLPDVSRGFVLLTRTPSQGFLPGKRYPLAEPPEGVITLSPDGQPGGPLVLKPGTAYVARFKVMAADPVALTVRFTTAGQP